MTLLIVGIVVFLGLHLLPTVSGFAGDARRSSWRERLQALFSLLSAVGFVLLVYGFAKAPVDPDLVAARLDALGGDRADAARLHLSRRGLCAGPDQGARSSIPSSSPSRPGRSPISSPMAISPRSSCSARSWLMRCYDRITLKRRQATGLVTVAARLGRRATTSSPWCSARALRGVSRLAAPAPDRRRALAELRQKAAFRPVFCTAKLPIFLP